MKRKIVKLLVKDAGFICNLHKKRLKICKNIIKKLAENLISRRLACPLLYSKTRNEIS